LQTTVYNVGRDEARVYLTDNDADSLIKSAAPVEEDAVSAAPVEEAPTPTPASAPSAPVAAVGAAPAEDITFTASDAIATLLAYSAKLRPEQIGDTDTTDS
ncbi:hypothetical protein QP201_26850, partial [Escherichia coli]|nr:hypothetical protein [Escherichia coli]